MAIGTSVTIPLAGTPASQHNVYPASVFGPWQTVVDAGGLDDADSDITLPSGFASSRRLILPFFNCRGTSLVFSAFYKTTNTVNAGGTYGVWGRHSADHAWTRLQSRAGALTSTPTYAPTTDPSDGTLSTTVPDILDDVWDGMGFSEFVVGITTAYTCTGTATTAGLFCKAL